MKLIIGLSVVIITSAFAAITSGDKYNRLEKIDYLRDSINRETYINQELFEIKIKKLQTN